MHSNDLGSVFIPAFSRVGLRFANPTYCHSRHLSSGIQCLYSYEKGKDKDAGSPIGVGDDRRKSQE